ncbi:uncharacterized protein LOC111279116 [Durio zibethinus]|uniref:Uncharacterized protein LOC111279116 n=1 Tax=Durio zibethinus TaxID=66656 RepID=A0A6P5X005_DURZI|nr:uncharacterized protein LOC111279116 [Durio zibethinus]
MFNLGEKIAKKSIAINLEQQPSCGYKTLVSRVLPIVFSQLECGFNSQFLMIMKNLVMIFFALVLFLATVEVDGKSFSGPDPKPLSNQQATTSSLDRKADVEAREAKDSTANAATDASLAVAAYQEDGKLLSDQQATTSGLGRKADVEAREAKDSTANAATAASLTVAASQEDRKLLSDQLATTRNLGRKADVGARVREAKDSTENAATAESLAVAASQEDGDTNPTFGHYGSDNGPSDIWNHHVYTTGDNPYAPKPKKSP